MQKSSLVAIVLSLALAVPFIGAGQANAQALDLQALVKQLQEQVLALQAQVVSLQAQLKVTKEEVQTTREEVAEVKAELKITRSLERGATGDEVRELQEFLKNFPDIYPSGLVTGYFGPQTETAVRKLQEKQGIEAVGIVGPKTLAKINELLTEGAGASGKVPPGLTGAPGIQTKLAATTTTILPPAPAPTSTLTAPTTTATTTETVATTTVAYVPPAVTPSVVQTTTPTTPAVTTTPTTTGSGSPPPAPSALYIVSGGTTPSTGTSYGYSVLVYQDPDGDEVKPIFDWGDGTTYEWTSFISPPATGGTTAQTSKTWTTAGTFSVKAKVKDATGRESGWGPITQIMVSGSSSTSTATTATSTVTTAATSTPAAASITVTYPNGGETLGYLSYNFSYNASGVSMVQYKLLKGSQVVYEKTTPTTVGSSLSFVPFPNDSSFASYQSGSDYTLRVYDWNNPGTYDDSDAHFNVDVTSPLVSSASVTSITANSAVIAWTTDEPANSQVNYGSTSSNWTVTPIDYTKVTSHAVTLTGLTSGTLYKYRFMSVDGTGNSTQTPLYPAEYTFTTLSNATTTSAISQNNLASILEALSSLLQNLQQTLRR